MIKIKTEVVKNWLDTINRNQNWLAKKTGYTEGYISQTLRNECKVSREIIEAIYTLSHMPIEYFLEIDTITDTRERYGCVYVIDGEPMSKKRYYDYIRSNKLQKEKELLDIVK